MRTDATMFGRRVAGVVLFGAFVALWLPADRAGAAPTVEQTLQFRPVQPDVEYDRPDPSEYARCRVRAERYAQGSGWVVLGPAGQVLRRYVDTNGDNIVDQWRYYLHGLEVYRDIDSDFDRKVDQSRWFNTGGTRWALDRDQDGRVDAWKRLSAQEASLVVVQALVRRDEALLRTVLLSPEDMQTLGLSEDVRRTIGAQLADAGAKMRQALAASKVIDSRTRWMRFDAGLPGTIPVDAGRATGELTVFENAMAIVETDGRTAFVQLGELVKVGEVWKLTQIPKPLEESLVEVALGGPLMQPEVTQSPAGDAAVVTGLPPAAQKVLARLQQLDQSVPPADDLKQTAQYNLARAELLGELAQTLTEPGERTQWLKQMIDALTAAAQTGQSPRAVAELKALERRYSTERATDLVAYVTYRRLLVEYTLAVQQAKPDEQAKLQNEWLASLEEFLQKFPKSEDAPDAMLQLAAGYELTGKTEDAQKWYGRLAADFAETVPGRRAAGALRRLSAKGKPFRLTGRSLDGKTRIDVEALRGKVVLVSYWATWCVPCTASLPQLRALYEQYHDKGFEIVGVCLDSTPENVPAFLHKHHVSWPQIYEPGGLDSPPAQQYGVISLPTIFLLDREGKVVSQSTSPADLKAQLDQLLR
ncbi:MAG: thioredoxin [Planctomycetota bacterium]|nr:MAG: thioredoxin [Planctomycetota bacterium]